MLDVNELLTFSRWCMSMAKNTEPTLMAKATTTVQRQ